MRIIQLVRATTWGGGERYALDLCGRSAETGDKVTVVSRGIPAVDSRFSHLPVEMVKIPLGGFLDFSSPGKLARLIMSYPEERVIIHVHNFKDAEIVARAKKIIGHREEVRLICTRHLVKRGKRSVRWKFILNAIDRLIFVSDLAKREFLSSNPPIDPIKIGIIHNSIVIPGKFATPVPAPSDREIKLLFTGRLSPEKGIDTLIKALPLLSDIPIRLRIAGTGSKEYQESLLKLAADLGVTEKIDWIGFIPDVYEEVRKADICVAPSRARESFGLTVIEAMSQGRPIVTTDNGAQPEIITDGKDGLLIRPEDENLLAEAIRKLSADPDLRREMGRNAFNTFSARFSYD
ncbi:MAG: glycosyltransferase family 4 protein, partial [Muribaculaceae bacterium]|nr:glycosyltransferase family 4 protein [Muribaculaceae bacterium]